MIDETYRVVLDTLRHHLRSAGIPFQEDDGDLIFNDHRLGLSIAFEGFTQQEGQLIAPLDVQIHLDGDSGDRFRVGTLGVGADRLSAIRSAVERVAFAGGGAGPGGTRGGRSHPPQAAGGPVARHLGIVSGRAGIRGVLPPGLDPGGVFHRLLLDAIQRFVRGGH